MSFSSVSVVTNALRLRFFTPRWKALPDTADMAAVTAEINYCMEIPENQITSEKDKKSGGTIMKKTIKIEGMMCMHCVKAATKALEAVEGVTAVAVSLEEKQAVVEIADSVTEDALIAAITEEGFKVTEIA